jgi:hypothetical protein
MNLDEALIECVAGQRITADHMQFGCYVEHTFGRGFVRCWPVSSASDEPSRTQCDFVTKPEDIVADWRIIVDQYPKRLKLDPRKGGW